jgi:hypothetical protein
VTDEGDKTDKLHDDRLTDICALSVLRQLDRAKEEMDLSEEEEARLALYLSLVWREGFSEGRSEVVTRALEQGVDVYISRLRRPRDEGGEPNN